MKKPFLSLAILLTLIVCFSSMKVFAQEEHDLQSVQAEGTAVVLNNNLARAQGEAIRDALRKAVEKSVARFLSPELIASKTQILKKNIYSVADTYIQTYKIISGTPSQKVYAVNLTAMVDYTALKDDLKAFGFVVAAQMAKDIVTVSMIVRGIRSYPDYARFIDVLHNDIDVIKNVYIRCAERGIVRFDVDTEGSLPILADKLGKTGKFSFHLNQVSDDQLEITLLD